MKPHIRDADFLMGDKSIEPKVCRIVVTAINEELTMKRLSKVDGQMMLTADNLNCPYGVGNFYESMI